MANNTYSVVHNFYLKLRLPCYTLYQGQNNEWKLYYDGDFQPENDNIVCFHSHVCNVFLWVLLLKCLYRFFPIHQLNRQKFIPKGTKWFNFFLNKRKINSSQTEDLKIKLKRIPLNKIINDRIRIQVNKITSMENVIVQLNIL